MEEILWNELEEAHRRCHLRFAPVQMDLKKNVSYNALYYANITIYQCENEEGDEGIMGK